MLSAVEPATSTGFVSMYCRDIVPHPVSYEHCRLFPPRISYCPSLLCTNRQLASRMIDSAKAIRYRALALSSYKHAQPSTHGVFVYLMLPVQRTPIRCPLWFVGQTIRLCPVIRTITRRHRCGITGDMGGIYQWRCQVLLRAPVVVSRSYSSCCRSSSPHVEGKAWRRILLPPQALPRLRRVRQRQNLRPPPVRPPQVLPQRWARQRAQSVPRQLLR